jgi:RNA polymerase sigma factor (sigma-70 family)
MTALPPFQRLLDDHADEIWRFLDNLVGDQADDAFQETWLRALAAYPRLRHQQALRAWLFTIARNVAIDVFRRPATEVLVEVGVSEDDPGAVDRLVALMAPLPARQRQALSWRFVGQLSYREIAEQLQCREDTARRAVADGLNNLRTRLDAHDYSHS